MREDAPIGIDEHALDDAALETLAEAYAMPPPPALRARLLAEAGRETARRRSAAIVRRWRLAGAVAAGMAFVLGALLARDALRAELRAGELLALAATNARLSARLDEQDALLAGLRASSALQGEILRIFGAPRALSAALAPREAGGPVAGRVLVDAASGEAAVVVSGLAPAGAGKIYELWAIRGALPPEPAGLFAVSPADAIGARVVRVERPAEITAFAVSLEPEGGSAAPTGPIVLVGAVAS